MYYGNWITKKKGNVIFFSWDMDITFHKSLIYVFFFSPSSFKMYINFYLFSSIISLNNWVRSQFWVSSTKFLDKIFVKVAYLWWDSYENNEEHPESLEDTEG